MSLSYTLLSFNCRYAPIFRESALPLLIDPFFLENQSLFLLFLWTGRPSWTAQNCSSRGHVPPLLSSQPAGMFSSTGPPPPLSLELETFLLDERSLSSLSTWSLTISGSQRSFPFFSPLSPSRQGAGLLERKPAFSPQTSPCRRRTGRARLLLPQPAATLHLAPNTPKQPPPFFLIVQKRTGPSPPTGRRFPLAIQGFEPTA